MNSRQAKKKAKNCYYLGVADAFMMELPKLQQAILSGKSGSFSLNPTPVGLGHNQHHFYKFAKFGKAIYNKYKQ